MSLAVAISLLATGPAATAPPTISRSELATTDPAVMHRKLRDLVWDLIEVKDFRDEASGKGQLNRTSSLSSLTLQTKVMPGATRGLCRRQIVSVRVSARPAAEGPPGYRADALYTHTKFHFFQPPSGIYNSSWYQYAANPECAGLAANTRFFHAANEQAAHDGYLHFLQAREAVRAGTLKVECDEIVRDNYKTDCRNDVLQLEQRAIDEIAGCSEIRSEDCFSIISDINSRRIEVQMGGSPWRPVRLWVGFFASATIAGR
jgi:hypothetical protein